MVREFWSKHKITILLALAILVLLVSGKCTRDRQLELEGQKEVLVEQLKQSRDSIKQQEISRNKEKDSLNKVNSDLEASSLLLREKDGKNQQKIANLNLMLDKTRKEIKNYTSNQIAQSINARYKTNTTTSTDNTFTGSTDTGQKIVTELAEKDACEETVEIKDEQLRDKDSIISNVTEQRDNEHIKNISAEHTIDMFKDYQKKSEEIHKVDNKIIKRLKTRTTLQWFLIVGAGVGGYLLAK